MSAHNPGFFLLPATSPMFTCFSTLFTFLVVKSLKTRWNLEVLCLTSVFLTMSRIGFCVVFIILGTLLARNYLRILLPVIVPTSYLLTRIIISFFWSLHYFDQSLVTRQKVFSSTLEEKEPLAWLDRSILIYWLFSANFGLGINAAARSKKSWAV